MHPVHKLIFGLYLPSIFFTARSVEPRGTQLVQSAASTGVHASEHGPAVAQSDEAAMLELVGEPCAELCNPLIASTWVLRDRARVNPVALAQWITRDA